MSEREIHSLADHGSKQAKWNRRAIYSNPMTYAIGKKPIARYVECKRTDARIRSGWNLFTRRRWESERALMLGGCVWWRQGGIQGRVEDTERSEKKAKITTLAKQVGINPFSGTKPRRRILIPATQLPAAAQSETKPLYQSMGQILRSFEKLGGTSAHYSE